MNFYINGYDLLNITKIDEEQVIKSIIDETREKLRPIGTDLMCRIYSSYVAKKIREKHIVNRLVDINEFGCSYSHQFNLVPLETEKYILIDLTFEQFHSKEFNELKEHGYMIINSENFIEYIKVIKEITEYNKLTKKTKVKVIEHPAL